MEPIPPHMGVRRFYLPIFLVSFAALLLEVAYTRIVAFKLYYYFTYLVIGFALLGLGAGGTLVALSSRLRAMEPGRLVSIGCALGGGVVALGYFVIAALELETFRLFDDPLEFGRLLLLCLALFAGFAAIGTVLARILSAGAGSVHRLYGADLLGAALACGAAIPLMNGLDPPALVFVAAAALVAAGLPLARRDAPRLFAPGSALVVVLAAFALYPGALPDPVADRIKELNPGKLAKNNGEVLFSRWNPVFRVDVYTLKGLDRVRLIAHDGILGSTLQRFDGDLGKLRRFDSDARAYPFNVGKRAPRVLIIGAAGGHEVLASLYFGATTVTGVELNPVTTSLVREHFADFTGHLTDDPRVTWINADGRSYLEGSDAEFDLVYFVAPDSYTAMNGAASGAFVLSESYLYTREMILETLGHLSDDGILCMQFGEFFYDRKPNRTARYAATARQALAELGVTDFGRHILVATNPDFVTFSTILLKKTPFTQAQVDAFLATAKAIPDARPRHAWGRQLDDGLVNQVISLPDAALERLLDTHPHDVSPISDDSPFFWHFARFSDALSRGPDAEGALVDHEDAIGERVLMALLGVAVLFAALFLLLPFWAVRATWRDLPAKAHTVVYFGGLGLGFMFFEIVLIQKLVRLLGYPTYSLVVTLLSLLAFSAAGSWLAGRYPTADGRVMATLLVVLAGLTTLLVFVLTPVIDAMAGTPLPARVAVAVAFIAPLGVCLGAFMPLGLARVASLSDHVDEYVAWGWAVNGFFSVIGSVLTTILSMAYGFTAVLVLGLLTYALAAWVLAHMPARAST